MTRSTDVLSIMLTARLDCTEKESKCASYVGPMHYLWDLQILFFSKNNFKTESHDTIYIFKNYFATVFSVFSNKWYLNRL